MNKTTLFILISLLTLVVTVHSLEGATLSVEPSEVIVGENVTINASVDSINTSFYTLEVSTPTATLKFKTAEGKIDFPVQYTTSEPGEHLVQMSDRFTKDILANAVFNVNSTELENITENTTEIFLNETATNNTNQTNVTQLPQLKITGPKQKGIKLKLMNSKKEEVSSRVKLYKNGAKVYDNLINDSIQPGKYDVELQPTVKNFMNVRLKNCNITENLSLGIESLNKKINIRGKQTIDAFAMDPSSVDFDSGTVTRIATGTELWKCKDWNFTTQFCYGDWIKILDLVPGEPYNFTIDPVDPGFAETNQTHFDGGTYNRTFYNSSFVQLNTTDNNGTFTSQIFDATSTSQWDNITWMSNAVGELPNNQDIETKFVSGNFDMTDNVLLYHMNEQSANSAPGGHDIEDFSGSGIHGNESGGVTFNDDGKIKSGIGFDEINDYINITDFDYGSNFTLAFWVKATDNAGTSFQYIFSHGSLATANSLNVLVAEDSHASDVVRTSLYDSSNQPGIVALDITPASALADGTWHHYALTVGPSDIRVFIDGDHVINATSGGGSYNPTTDIILGAHQDLDSTRFFGGELDEVAIWNKTLTPTDISNIYKRGTIKLNLSVRSCNDAACSGEGFTDVNDTYPLNLSITDNRYFQYRFEFATNNSNYSSELYNVTINYTDLPSTPPSINYTAPTPANNTIVGQNWILVNVTVTDDNEENITFYLYNSSSNLNATTLAAGNRNINFTNLIDGIYYYNVTVRDMDSNENSTKTQILTLDTTAPIIFIESPTNNSGDNDGNIMFVYNTTDVSAVSNCSLMLNGIYNQTDFSISKDISQNFTLNNLNASTFNWIISCEDQHGTQATTSTIYFTIIKTTDFGGDTTDLSSVPDVSNIIDFTIHNPGLGKIVYSDPLDLSGGIDLSNGSSNQPLVQIDHNIIAVDTDDDPRLDGNATLTFYNLSFVYEPVAIMDNDVCSPTVCMINNYTGGNFSFNVTHFTAYTAGSNSQLQIYDSTDNLGGNQKRYVTEEVTFFANYSNRTSGESINGTNIYCTIEFFDGTENMTFNTSSSRYNYTRKFDFAENYNWNVFCNGTADGFEVLNVTDIVTIKTHSNWWDSDWSHCSNVFIPNYGNTSLINYPAFVEVEKRGNMQSDFDDIRFVDSTCDNGGIVIDYEIEWYNSTEADFWVEIDNVPVEGRYIAMYYGNLNAVLDEDITGTWNADFGIVYHMDSAGEDSTSNNRDRVLDDGTPSVKNTFLGEGLNFSDGNAWNQSNMAYWEPEWSTRSHEVIFETGGDVSTRQVLFAEGGATNGAMLYILSGDLYARWWSETQGWNGGSLNVSISANTAYHVAMTYTNPGNYSLYLDGQLIDSNVSTDLIAAHTGEGGIAFTGTDTKDFHDTTLAGQYFNGSIYEFRVMDSAPSIGWFNTTYNLIFNSMPLGPEISHFPAIKNPVFNGSIFEPNDNVLFNVTVTDILGDDTVVYVNATFQYPGGTKTNVSLTQVILTDENATSEDQEEGTSNALALGPDRVIGETGNITIGDANQYTVFFNRTYSSTPVVIATPVTQNAVAAEDDSYIIPTIHVVNQTFFNISICRDDGFTTCSAPNASETIHYFVFDVDLSARYSWLDVGTVTTTTAGADTTLNFGKTFTNVPVIFTTPNTYSQNGNIAAVVWVEGTAQKSTSSAPLIGCVHQAPGSGSSVDVCEPGQPSETVGYVAIDMSEANITSLQNGSADISNSAWTAATFSPTYTEPRVMVTENDDDGGQDPQYPWARNVVSGGMDFRYCEQDAADVCHSHTGEVVNWFALEQGNIDAKGGTPDIDENTTYTTYMDVDDTIMSNITNINVTVEVTYYNNSGSSTTGNSNPDLELQLATENGNGWAVIGNFGVTGTGNFSVNTTNTTIRQAWKQLSVRDLRIRGVNFDYNNSNDIDQINWTSLTVRFTYDSETPLWQYTWTDTLQRGNYSVTDIKAADDLNLTNHSTYSNVSFRVEIIPLTAFNLTSPANQTVSTNLQPNLTWNQTTGKNFANYTILLDLDPTFATPDFTYHTFEIDNTSIVTDPLTADITYFWKVIAYNIFGNATPSNQNFTYITDTTDPVIVLNTPLNNDFVTTSSFQFNYTPTDANLLNCSLYTNQTGSFTLNQSNTTPTSGQSNFFDATLGDGVYIWNVLCYDKANLSDFAPVNYTVIVDTIPPVINLEGPANNTLETSTNNILFEYNVTDAMADVASCEIIVDDTVKDTDITITETTTQNFTVFVDNGQHNWSVNCTDENGFEDASLTFNLSVNVLVEFDPPVITLNFPPEKDFLNTSTVVFNYTPTDATGIENCSIYIDGILNQTNTTVANAAPNYFTINNFNNQLYLWNVTCYDNNSFALGASSTRNFTVDLIDPTVVLNTPLNDTIEGSSTVVFNYTPTDTNLLNCSLHANFSGSFQEIESKTDVTTGIQNNFTRTVADGSYIWNIICYDKSDRSSFAPENYSVVVDAIAPAYYNISVDPSSPATFTTPQTYEFNITWLDDHLDTVLLEHNFTGTLQNITLTSATTIYTFNITNLAASNYVYKWIANDTLGKVNETQQFTYVVQKAAPDINLTLNGTRTNITFDNEGFVNITAELIDPTTGFLELYLNGVQINNGTSPINNHTYFSVPGTYNVTATYPATQNYTNGSETHFIIINDTILPNVSLITPLNDTTVGTSQVIFSYNVTDANTILNCSLHIDQGFYSTDTSITKNITQTFIETFADGNYTWEIYCQDVAGNVGVSELRNFSVFDSTHINVTVNISEAVYQQGEIADINTTTRDIFGTVLRTNVTADVIYTNGTTTNYSWWNTSWSRRKIIVIEEDTGTNETDARVNISVDTQTLISEGKLDADCNATRFTDVNRNPISHYMATACNSASTQFYVKVTLKANQNVSIFMYYDNPSAVNASSEASTYSIIGETGEVNISDFEWSTLSFRNDYAVTPVVIATPVTQNGAAGEDDSYLIPTISMINKTGVNMTICQDNGATTCDATVAEETLHYFVFDVNKSNEYSWIDVGTVTVTTAGADTTLNYGKTFTNVPVIFTTPNTYSQNGNIAAIAWVEDTATKTTSSAPLIGCVHQAPGSGTSVDVCEGGQPSETVGYVAIDMSEANITDLQNGSASIADSTWTAATFSPTYTEPRVMVTQNDDNGAQDPQYSWARNIVSGGMDYRYCEQDAADVCNTHTGEVTNWFALESGDITVAKNPVNRPNVVEDEELHVQRTTNDTQIDGIDETEFDTLDKVLGNYSVVSVGTRYLFSDGIGSSSFELVPDTTPPNITLNLPVNRSNTSSTSVTFNWTAFDFQRNQTCNLTVDSTVEFGNVFVNNSQNVNRTVTGISEGRHYWNVTCWDKFDNINTSLTREFVVDLTGPTVNLNLPVESYNTSDTNINFNWTAIDTFDAQPVCNISIDSTVEFSDINSLNNTWVNQTVTGITFGTRLWNVTCVDMVGNIGNSTTRTFVVLGSPSNLIIELESNLEDVLLNWTPVTEALSYDIYFTENFTLGFSGAPDVTGITDTNYTDTTANLSSRKFYMVSAVRGSAEQNMTTYGGKYDAELEENFNLLSFPLIPNDLPLKNATNDGYEFALQPTCLVSLWKYNSTGFERTDWDGSVFTPASGSDNFTSLNATRGYWLETNQSCNLTFIGRVPSQNLTIPLADGWSIVSWYSSEEKKLPTDSEPVLLSVTPTNAIQAIDRYNATSGEFEVTIHYEVGGTPWGWFPSFNNQQFTHMDPTIGYYFDTTPTASWEHEP